MKHFEFNWNALFMIVTVWSLFMWIPLIAVEEPGKEPPLWVGLLWLAPLGIAFIIAAIVGIVYWLRSEDGWLIRRKRA